MKRFIAFLLLPLLWSVQSFASTYPVATAANGARIWTQSTGGSVVTVNPPAGTAGAIPTALSEVAPVAAPGGVTIGASGLLNVLGRSLLIAYAGYVSQSAIVGALQGALIGGQGAGLYGAVAGAVLGGSAPLLAQWLSSAGVSFNASTKALQQVTPGLCTTGTCYFWRTQTDDYQGYTSALAACQGDYGSQVVSFVAGVGTSSPGGACENVNGSPLGYAFTVATRPDDTVTYQSVPPASLSQILADYPVPPGAVDELSNAGVAVPVTNESVSGPSSVPGKSSTTTNPDGSSTTTITTQNYTYNNTNITVGPATTTVTDTAAPPADGSSAATSSSTTTSSDSQPQAPPVGTPMPGIPNLYTQKYPQGLAGVWNTDSAALQSTPLMSLPAQLMPSIPDGGACPDFPISLDFAPWANFGNQDFAPPCSIWTFCQAIIMITALFAARFIVFGG